VEAIAERARFEREAQERAVDGLVNFDGEGRFIHHRSSL
jgi:hypothetical protein